MSDTSGLRVAVWHDLPTGGGRRALIGHVEGLVRLGHVVRVWSTPQPAGPLRLADDVRSAVSQDAVPIPQPSVNAGKIVPTVWDKLRLTRSPNSVRVMRGHLANVARDVRAWGADVVFAGSSERLGVADVAGALPELPSVLYVQEPFRPSYEDMGDPAWRAIRDTGSGNRAALRTDLADLVRGQRQRLLARDEWLAASAYGTILVNSMFSRETVRRVFGVSATVCALGVDDTVFVDRQLTREPFLLAVGQFEQHKRPRLVVEAIAGMERPLPLVWVGSRVNETLLADVEAHASAAGVIVDVRRDVSDDQLVDLYNRCRANVYAPVLEPFGYTPVEAALCGAPTVGVAEAGLRETVLDGVTGLLAEPDPTDLARALDRVAMDGAFAAELGTRARDHALATFPLQASQRRLERHLRETHQRCTSR